MCASSSSYFHKDWYNLNLSFKYDELLFEILKSIFMPSSHFSPYDPYHQRASSMFPDLFMIAFIHHRNCNLLLIHRLPLTIQRTSTLLPLIPCTLHITRRGIPFRKTLLQVPVPTLFNLHPPRTQHRITCMTYNPHIPREIPHKTYLHDSRISVDVRDPWVDLTMWQNDSVVIVAA
jgi:hypothetical protein